MMTITMLMLIMKTIVMIATMAMMMVAKMMTTTMVMTMMVMMTMTMMMTTMLVIVIHAYIQTYSSNTSARLKKQQPSGAFSERKGQPRCPWWQAGRFSWPCSWAALSPPFGLR